MTPEQNISLFHESRKKEQDRTPAKWLDNWKELSKKIKKGRAPKRKEASASTVVNVKASKNINGNIAATMNKYTSKRGCEEEEAGAAESSKRTTR